MFLSKILTLLCITKHNQTLLRDTKRFCRYCCQPFSTAQILETYVNQFFFLLLINAKQLIETAKKDGTKITIHDIC